MSITAFVIVWIVAGLLSAFMIIRALGRGGFEFGRDAAGVFAAAIVVSILAALGLISLVLALVLFAFRKREATGYEADGSEEAIIIRMLEQRRKVDRALKREKHPANWPMFQLWMAPEAQLLHVVDSVIWQLDVENVRPSNEELGDRVMRRLPKIAEYLTSLDPRLLSIQIAMAEGWVSSERERQNLNDPYPRASSWRDLLTDVELKELDQSLSSDRTPSQDSMDWRRLIGRRAPTDEVRHFDIGPRAGVVLVRDGRPIDHVDMIKRTMAVR